jgi:hypothetical protein
MPYAPSGSNRNRRRRKRSSVLWVLNLDSDTKGRAQTDCIRERGAEENIWAEEGRNDRRLR